MFGTISVIFPTLNLGTHLSNPESVRSRLSPVFSITAIQDGDSDENPTDLYFRAAKFMNKRSEITTSGFQ